MVEAWDQKATWQLADELGPHEAHFLKLDSSKARAKLGWSPRLPLPETLQSIIDWSRSYQTGADVKAMTLAQISDYLNRSEKNE
jgi:CDP-glucose 4,6-dehydratase